MQKWENFVKIAADYQVEQQNNICLSNSVINSAITEMRNSSNGFYATAGLPRYGMFYKPKRNRTQILTLLFGFEGSQ